MTTTPHTTTPTDADVPTRTVKVRDHATEDALWGTPSNVTAVIRAVILRWVCPTCGGPRGEVSGHNFHVDGDWHHVNVWDNPCGHVDMYHGVMVEAKTNGLNG